MADSSLAWVWGKVDFAGFKDKSNQEAKTHQVERTND